MKETISKSRLAIILSQLSGFDQPKVREEQYLIDSEVCASLLWNAYILNDIDKKIIVDLGCGTGILGIGALLLGAKYAYLVDSDKKALEKAQSNFCNIKSEYPAIGKAEFICQNIEKADIRANTVIQNPPFGTKVKHKDTIFLKKAIETASVVYSLHKSETLGFLERFASDNYTKITHIWNFKFPLKATFSFHRRKIHRINVSCLRFEKVFK